MNHKPVILLADDDQRLLEALTVRFEHLGYTVVKALDGYNSTATAVKQHPDVMVLDVNMPAGSGFSVQERVNSLDARTKLPVIYMTGDQSDKIIERATNIGAVGVIHKPFLFENLAKMVERALQPRAA